MNYRHIYHAGNFADVVKHVVLALVIEHLKKKAGPFRVIDSHAGCGLYDLRSEQAEKTGEWRDGVGRLLSADVPQDVALVLEPFFSVLSEFRDCASGLSHYPGSPVVARRLLRAGDVLLANEAHPEDFQTLRAQLIGDKQSKVLSLDGWQMLTSVLPPKERRGVILIDPPFEMPGEFQRLADSLHACARRFATGVYLLWYPIKEIRDVERFQARVARLGLGKLMAVDVFARSVRTATELSGTGLLVLNPPYTLGEKLRVVMPFLTELLARGAGAHFRLVMLTDEQGRPVETSLQ